MSLWGGRILWPGRGGEVSVQLLRLSLFHDRRGVHLSAAKNRLSIQFDHAPWRGVRARVAHRYGAQAGVDPIRKPLFSRAVSGIDWSYSHVKRSFRLDLYKRSMRKSVQRTDGQAPFLRT